MASDELRFKHVGLSSDGAVLFCSLDNGKTYAMLLRALDRAENWDPDAKPKSVAIIHDGYAAVVKFDNRMQIDFPSDFVLHQCEPTYSWYKDKERATTGVGQRIRQIREWRGLTLDALAAKCGIKKPNLSRLENDKVTPRFETLQVVAAALETHPALLVASKKPGDAWTVTRHAFENWIAGLKRTSGSNACQPVASASLVGVFLERWPEHGYAAETDEACGVEWPESRFEQHRSHIHEDV